MLPKKNSLFEYIAPQLTELGIMLPSTPLHYLLFKYLLTNPLNNHWLQMSCDVTLLVTSANISGEPLIKDDHEAMKKLSSLADQIVQYDRNIITHADDSVVKLAKTGSIFIRRARGYVPEPILLSEEIPSIIGLGDHLKNTICVTKGKEAFVSQHIGSLNNLSSRRCYHDTLTHLLKLFKIKPEYIAHDAHPDFYTTQIANNFGIPAY